MKEHRKHIVPKLYFSRWSRKGYAVFAALGKNVCISPVGRSVCECALLKSAGKGVIADEAGCAEPAAEEKENTERRGKYSGIATRGEVCPAGEYCFCRIGI